MLKACQVCDMTSASYLMDRWPKRFCRITMRGYFAPILFKCASGLWFQVAVGWLSPSHAFWGSFLSWCQHRAAKLMAPLSQNCPYREYPSCSGKMWLQHGRARLSSSWPYLTAWAFTKDSWLFQHHAGAAHTIRGTQAGNSKLLELCLQGCSLPVRPQQEHLCHSHTGIMQNQTPVKCFSPCWEIFLLRFGDIS